MLHEELKKYRELSGDTNPHTPISRIGGYLDGYERALEQKPREDAISRLEVLDEINRIGIKAFETYNDYSELFDFVDCLPSVNPQPKIGHWKEHNKPYDIDGTYYCYCDNCGGDAHEKTDFCPSCGAKMVEPQESEDKEDVE